MNEQRSLTRTTTRAVATEQRSPHNRVIAILLAVFFGGWGIHRFYTGKFWTGILWFLTGGLFLFGWIYDVIVLATGTYRDSQGRVLGPPSYEHRPRLETDLHRSGRPQPPMNPRGQGQHPPQEPEDPYLEEAMRDPLEDKFAELERQTRANKGRDGSI